MNRLCFFEKVSTYCDKGNYTGYYNVACYMKELKARQFVQVNNDEYCELSFKGKPFILLMNNQKKVYRNYRYFPEANYAYAMPVIKNGDTFEQLSYQEYSMGRSHRQYSYVYLSTNDRLKIHGYIRNKRFVNLRYDVYEYSSLELLAIADPKFLPNSKKHSRSLTMAYA